MLFSVVGIGPKPLLPPGKISIMAKHLSLLLVFPLCRTVSYHEGGVGACSNDSQKGRGLLTYVSQKII
jgi:hypothetical protein